MRIVVTGTVEGAGPLVERLRAAGFDVTECPLIRIEPIPGPPLDLSGYDWLVLTSARAVDFLFERGVNRIPSVAVVGPGTAEALRTHGVEAAVVAGRSTQEGLVEAMPAAAGKVAFAAAEGARDVIARELRADVVPLYRTVELRPQSFPEGDLVVLASGSAARSFAALGIDRPCVAIGPVTATEARRLGLRIVEEATSYDLDGLVEAARLAGARLASEPGVL